MKHAGRAFLWCFAAGVQVWSQVISGSISGYVIDPSGGAIANAAVTLDNRDRAAHISSRTNATGLYRFDGLSPGAYRVSVSATGFETQESEPARVEVDRRVRLDFNLSLARAGEKIAVSARTLDVSTESGDLGAVLDRERIEQLPLNQRDFLQLALLTAGVSTAVEGSELSSRGTFAMHANGGREEANNFLLDGVDNNDSDNGGYVLQPSVDSIQEFRIATNSYSAEYGKAMAGQVNVITRAGTDEWHGSVYDYFRNRDLDARNFFDGTGRPGYIRNQFGAGAGGPVARGGTFFYGNFEGLRELQGLTQLGTVPSLPVRMGDLSSLGPVHDPFTGKPFAGNTIPMSRISPHASQVLALFPAPNLPGTSGNFLSAPIASGNRNQASARADRRLSDTAQLTLRYTYGRRDLLEPFAKNQIELPGFGDYVYDRGHNALIHYRRTFGARAYNSLIAGFNRAVRQVFPQNYRTDVNSLWGVGYLPTVPRDFGFPGISVTGYSRVGDVAALPIDRADNTYQLSDNFSTARGAHLLNAGGEVRDVQLNGYVELYSRGQLNFTGALTGVGIGDLLLGFPALGIQAHYTGPQTLRGKSWSGYFQDDWKASRSLTFNLGVRYEYDSPPVDPTNRMATFDFVDLKVEQVGTHGLPRSGTKTDRKNAAPRIGFAWSPAAHTVLRGGYGLYFDAGMFVVNSSLYYNPPFFTVSVFFPSQTSLITLDNPFASGNGITPAAQLSIVSPNFVRAYAQHWNLDVQREVRGAGLFSLAYAGSKGTHLPRSLDINQPLPGPGTVASRAPYSGFSNILETESGGNSEYQSLQFTFNRRLSKSLSVLAAYTFSKSIDDTSAFLPTQPDQNFPQDSHDYRLERAVSSYDVPHRATVAFVWDIPGSGRWARGFEASGIVAGQSEQPFTPVLSSDNSNTGNSGGNFGEDRPNLLHPPAMGNRSPAEWFDVTAFAIPAKYTWGNAGRNILRGPGLFTTDLSIRRGFRLGERAKLVVEAQAFNLLNRANFNLPDHFADQPATFGKIFSAKAPRQIQLALRVEF